MLSECCENKLSTVIVIMSIPTGISAMTMLLLVIMRSMSVALNKELLIQNRKICTCELGRIITCGESVIDPMALERVN